LHKRLKIKKDELFVALKTMLESYNAEREVLKRDHGQAVENTLKKYDDFFEWLQGKVLL